ncbi:MAG: hypothetical protein CMJ18_22025 [Phycisphaeraceae bacterium]|nr:hypothetical protein [Phycisphaeraceae bacterium]
MNTRHDPDRTSQRYAVGACALLVGAAAVLAGPMLKRKLPDEVRCLNGLETISLVLEPLPRHVLDNTTKESVDRVLRAALTKERFVVDDRIELPRLVVQFYDAVDESAPDTVGVTIVFSIHQRVHIHRLGQDMQLPVSTMVGTILDHKDDLDTSINRLIRSSINRFGTYVRMGTSTGNRDE